MPGPANDSESDQFIDPDDDAEEPQPDSGMRRGFAALRYRNYRLFFTGQLISVTGTWMQSLAQSWLVVDQLNASAFQLGLVNVFQFGPVLLLGIPAGVVADKIPKRTLMIGTQIIFSLLAAILAVLVASGNAQLWHVYLLATCFGLTNAFDMPARQAFVSEMVGKEALMNAIALNSAMFNTGRILGPAVAGVILAAFGPAICFAINSITYIAVITGLLMMNVKPLVKTAAGSAAEQLREGLSYVRRTPDVLRPVLMVAAIGVFGMSFNVWLPLLARDSFNADAGTFGLLFSSMGAGSLAGALAIAFFGREPSRIRMLIAAMSLGVMEIGVALAASVPLAVAVGMLMLAGCGFAASNAMAMANTIVQTTAPDALRGRVMAVYSTVFMGSTPIGALVAGGISQKAGVVPSMIVGGVVVTIVALTLTWRQRASRDTATVPVMAATSGSKHP